MQTSINNSATFFCYTAPAPTPSHRSMIFDGRKAEYWNEKYSSIVVVNTQNIILNSRIINLIKDISKLENNWDYENAIVPTRNVIASANSLVYLLEKRGQKIFHVAPGPNGEIMLDIRNSRKTKSVEIIFYKNKSIVIFFPETMKPSQSQFEIDNLSIILHWLNQ